MGKQLAGRHSSHSGSEATHGDSVFSHETLPDLRGFSFFSVSQKSVSVGTLRGGGVGMLLCGIFFHFSLLWSALFHGSS